MNIPECLLTKTGHDTFLYNSSLDWLPHRPGSDFRTLRDSLRKDLTSLRSENPDYWKILLNVSDGTLQRAIINHLRHTAPTVNCSSL